MAINKTKSGKWLVDIKPTRDSKRFRKTFTSLSEAKAWNAWVTTNSIKFKEWLPEVKDKRKMTELADIWYSNHGRQLKAGRDTLDRIKAAFERMNNPSASQFNDQMFMMYRTERLENNLKVSTINREYSYIRAMINELNRLGLWHLKNPLKKVRKFKEVEKELTYLTHDQIDLLLIELSRSQNPSVLLTAKICLATGARWGESQTLTINRVRNGRIQFTDTKSGRNRSVPISSELEKDIYKHAKKYAVQNRLFVNSYSAFRRALGRTGIQLPAGQLTHVLRHTFASHFMINGGNILILQRALGHQDLKTTMRYAHLSPKHLESVIELNPLAYGVC